MIRYAESNQCRMASVVRHFGDVADGEKPCGICDYCAPAQCNAQRFRTATAAEHAALLRVAAELRAGGAKSTGKLYAELFPHHEMSRDDFENLLGGMARAGIVRLDDAVFEKDGRQIPYRTARLTRAGWEVDAQTPLDLVMKDQRADFHPPQAQEEGRGQRRWPWAESRAALLANYGHGSAAGFGEESQCGRRTRRRTWTWKRRCERGGWPRPGGSACPPSASLPTGH